VAYLVDLKTGAGSYIGNASWGLSDPQFSPNGEKILFSTVNYYDERDQNKQRDVYVWDLRTKSMTRASVTQHGREGNGPSDTAAYSPDGRRVVFLSKANNLVAGDTNDAVDVFVKDLQSGALARINVADGRGFTP
jgi:Tol biopolymer transport system component